MVAWNHGNEGGWDFTNEKAFHQFDIQRRPVIYPWLLRNGVDTHHYPEFDYGVGRYVNGNDPFMATELLHGLYDGGLGAGLEEYWKSYRSSPLHAGGFLWALADEAVIASVPGLEIALSKKDGTLLSVKNDKGNISLTGGPLPMDYDGDGDMDMVVSSGGFPSNGLYFFENSSGEKYNTTR